MPPLEEIVDFGLHCFLLPCTVALLIAMTMRRNVSAALAVGCGLVVINFHRELVDWVPGEGTGSSILSATLLMLLACQSPLAPGTMRLTIGIAWRAAAAFFAAKFCIPQEIMNPVAPATEAIRPGMGLWWIQIASFPVILGGCMALEYMATRIPNWVTSFGAMATAGATSILMLLAHTMKFSQLSAGVSACWLAILLACLAKSVRVYPAIASLLVFLFATFLPTWVYQSSDTKLPWFTWVLVGASPFFVAILHLLIAKTPPMSRAMILLIVWLAMLAAAIVIGFQFETIGV